MASHLKVFRAHRALGIFYGVIVALLVGVAISGVMGDEPGYIVPAIAFVALLMGVHLATAYGARDRKPGARIASMVIGALLLFGFPIGTVIGIYLLVHTVTGWEAAT